MTSLSLVPSRHATGVVLLPGSKSISNRALLLAALARGDTELTGLLDSDDTQVMRNALAVLGVALSPWAEGHISVHGVGGLFTGTNADIFVGNAGTATRLLVATLALAAQHGSEYRIDGVARMRERPIGDLVDALAQIGAAVEYTGNPGFPDRKSVV